MKNIPSVVIFILICAVSLFAQNGTPNTNPEPVSLAALAKEPVCGKQKFVVLDAAVKSAPTDPKVYLDRAVCYEITKNPAFIQDISTILNLNPPIDSNIYKSLVELIWIKPYDQSQQYLEYLITSNPNHWFPYDQRSLAKLNQKDYQGAIGDGVKAIELSPQGKTPNLWRLRDSLVFLSNDYSVLAAYESVFNVLRKKQQEIGRQLAELNSRSAEYSKIGYVFRQIGIYLQELCISWASRAVKLKAPQIESEVLEKMTQIESRAQAYFMRSRYFVLNGRLAQAKADSIRSSELQIEENFKKIPLETEAFRKAELYRQNGDTYFKLERYHDAIQNYELAQTFYRYNFLPNLALARQRLNLPNPSPNPCSSANADSCTFIKPAPSTNPNQCPPGITCDRLQRIPNPAVDQNRSPR